VLLLSSTLLLLGFTRSNPNGNRSFSQAMEDLEPVPGEISLLPIWYLVCMYVEFAKWFG